jgi:hypothetical protein
MSPQIAFFLSIACSVVAWSLVASRYVWPRLRELDRRDALRPFLIVNGFRFIGLAFTVPGVVSPDLPARFAHTAAYGDVVAAVLALVALASQSAPFGVALVWIFNVWGAVDLLNAFYQAGHAGLQPGQLGATYFIPTLLVPAYMITHVIVFRILLQHRVGVSHAASRRSSSPIPAGAGARHSSS